MTKRKPNTQYFVGVLSKRGVFVVDRSLPHSSYEDAYNCMLEVKRIQPGMYTIIALN
ncbi:hypothetical protein [Plectonema phage Pbo-yong3]|uniref:hypothetical protein n=1 Tax=Plectonema phage Pbo-yong3 TaxID=2970324 RepID=UPI00403D1123|nr:hypothetical protein [Plectonema phage Pbo-yong3]